MIGAIAVGAIGLILGFLAKYYMDKGWARDTKRIRIENDHLVEHNKKLANQVRLKAIEVKKLEKEVKKLNNDLFIWQKRAGKI